MTLALPAFDQYGVEWMRICAFFEADKKARFDWLKNEQHRGGQAKCRLGGKPSWIKLIMSQWDEKCGHFHLEVGLASAPQNMPSLPTVHKKEIAKAVTMMVGQNVEGRISGVYKVPIDNLPSRGIVRMLLGVKTEVCGSEMHLSGCGMRRVHIVAVEAARGEGRRIRYDCY